ncbi:hypothetical protein KC207_06665 [Phycicoccus sp. BSK3Z-2]|uniref:Heavy metal transporter n=1 Tax=Phycicoccus avicenniae TaxID=2828860 RepID=A0A941D9J1_9MICO|nr:hypothetical protein [Phycicoccus avicenniae]MBR7742967.1 hypothetical protein [Phycicoccus avicenniae]
MPRSRSGALTLAEEEPRSPRQRWLAGTLGVAVVGVLGVAGWQGVQHLLHAVASERCEVTVSGTTHRWAPDQASNAAAITAIGVKRGLPPRAASIAIATAMQESKVRNVRYGDRDSLGLFQQRPSQGWGSPEQILDPEYATNAFYDALVEVDGYDGMEIADAAQAVQRSAAGYAYAQHEGQARATASALSGQSPAVLGCALRDPSEPGDPEALSALLDKDFGLAAEVEGTRVRVDAADPRSAWAVAQWAVARASTTGATRVEHDGRSWTRAMDDAALTWAGDGSTGPGEVVIDLA